MRARARSIAECPKTDHGVSAFAHCCAPRFRDVFSSFRAGQRTFFALCFAARLTLPVGGNGARASVMRIVRMSCVAATRGVYFWARGGWSSRSKKMQIR